MGRRSGRWTVGWAVGAALALLTGLGQAAAEEWRAEYVDDVGHTDGESHTAGSTFSWTWRIKNAGTQTWVGQNVRLKRYGQGFFGRSEPSDEIALAYLGEDDVTLTGLTAPSTPDVYREYWHIYHGDTDFTRNLGFWIEITVPSGESPPPSDTDGLGATLVEERSLPAGSCVVSGQPATKSWLLANSGEVTWRAGEHALILTGGDSHSATDTWGLSEDVEPGDTAEISVELMPTGSGISLSTWQLEGPTGDGADRALFGPELTIEIDVNNQCDGSGGGGLSCNGHAPGSTQSCCEGQGVRTCQVSGLWSLCSASCDEPDQPGQGAPQSTPLGCSTSGQSGAGWATLMAALWLGWRRRLCRTHRPARVRSRRRG